MLLTAPLRCVFVLVTDVSSVFFCCWLVAVFEMFELAGKLVVVCSLLDEPRVVIKLTNFTVLLVQGGLPYETVVIGIALPAALCVVFVVPLETELVAMK